MEMSLAEWSQEEITRLREVQKELLEALKAIRTRIGLGTEIGDIAEQAIAKAEEGA